MTKSISISLYNRPRYTKILLDHLEECYNIENYHIIICCEPENNEVIELAQKFRPQQTQLIINKEKLGCNANIYQCLNIGFNINDYHIHLEDDTIPGKDFLCYCEWANDRFVNNTSIFSISGYCNSDNKIEQFFPKNNDYTSCYSRNWFTPWGWATWKNRWKSVESYIIEYFGNPNVSWDYVLHNKIRQYQEIFPTVSRIQNIGAEYGTFCKDSEWHKLNQYNEYWIESEKKYSQSFNFLGTYH